MRRVNVSAWTASRVSRNLLLLLEFNSNLCNAVLDCLFRGRGRRELKSLRRAAAITPSRVHEIDAIEDFERVKKTAPFSNLEFGHRQNALQNFGTSICVNRSAAIKVSYRTRSLDLRGLSSRHGPSLRGSRSGSDAGPAALGEELGRDGELVEAREGSSLNGHGIAKDHRLWLWERHVRNG